MTQNHISSEEVAQLRDIVLGGGLLSEEQVYSLVGAPSQALRDAAAAVTAKFCSRNFDSCSIVNARSGLCSEN